MTGPLGLLILVATHIGPQVSHIPVARYPLCGEARSLPLWVLLGHHPTSSISSSLVLLVWAP